MLCWLKAEPLECDTAILIINEGRGTAFNGFKCQLTTGKPLENLKQTLKCMHMQCLSICMLELIISRYIHMWIVTLYVCTTPCLCTCNTYHFVCILGLIFYMHARIDYIKMVAHVPYISLYMCTTTKYMHMQCLLCLSICMLGLSIYTYVRYHCICMLGLIFWGFNRNS